MRFFRKVSLGVPLAELEGQVDVLEELPAPATLCPACFFFATPATLPSLRYRNPNQMEETEAKRVSLASSTVPEPALLENGTIVWRTPFLISNVT